MKSVENSRGGVPKANFAPVPNRALWDRRLTAQDIRNIGIIAAHDRLSGSLGKGQGAWASQKRMAALAGADYSRFSTSLNKLLKLGYLQRDRLSTDRRKFTYRVVYTREDGLPSSKDIAAFSKPVVCVDEDLSRSKETTIEPQYIPQSGERDSAEAGKKIRQKLAVFAGNGFPCAGTRVAGGHLAMLERALQQDEEFDRLAYYGWLGDCVESEDATIRGWALRLGDRVLNAMSDEEYGEWLLSETGVPA